LFYSSQILLGHAFGSYRIVFPGLAENQGKLADIGRENNLLRLIGIKFECDRPRDPATRFKWD
jgi:hypothetical protein